MRRISVIIPALNEERCIGQTLSSLCRGPFEEVIVVDGGSADDTVRIARQNADEVLVTSRGRGHQMNHGAERASGDILFFLHADSRPPANGFGVIRDVLEDARVSAGAFDLAIDHPSPSFRVIEFGANLRSRITAIPYGDQGLFMKRHVFRALGGYAEVPLMEDVEIGRRLKRIGPVRFVRNRITTSPRRWLKEGLAYTTLRDWGIAISYAVFGVHPRTLRRYYDDVR